MDAKATDDKAPPLWGLIPLTPSPKTHAKVEIHQVQAENGFLPFAVPEIDPEAVFAIFVDDDTGAVVDSQKLKHWDTGNPLAPAPCTTLPFSCWVTTPGQEQVCITCNGTSNNTGVVILVSKEDPNPSMAGSLANICSPPPPADDLVACYRNPATYGSQSGLSFIHSFGVAGAPGAAQPNLRDVRLLPSGCPPISDLSAPYFTLEGDCTAAIDAVVDFGPAGQPDPTVFPICAKIDGFTWTSGGIGGQYGTWTGSMPLDADTGRNTLNIGWHSGPKTQGQPNACPINNQGSTNNGTFSKAAAPYVADAASGPVDYLKLSATDLGSGAVQADANSVPKGKDYLYTVAVGLEQPLRLLPATTDPILLRFASKADRKSGNLAQPLTQALDCDKGIKLELEVENGCQTFYALNYDDWDDNPVTPKTWADIKCAQYGPNDLPPPFFINSPTPICVAPKGGTVQDMQKGLADRFETPCTPNYWPSKNATQMEIKNFLLTHNFLNDPRYIRLIVTDNTAFQSPNQNEPVKYFAGFYATGWDQGGPQATGCDRTDQYLIDGTLQPLPASLNANDCHPLLSTSTNPAPSRSEPCTSYQKTKDNGDVWGHWVKFVVFSSSATPSEDVCDLSSTSAETCVAVLVE